MDNKVLITLAVLLCCAAVNARGATKLIFDRDLRIVGGSVARTAQFPHAVALVLHLTLQRSSFCGGSIIHPTYILTAAHCMDDVTRIEVQAGIQRIFRGTPTYRSIVQAGRNIRVHPQYNSETLLNDIALIFLVNRIPMNDVMQRIALPPRSHANNRFVGFFGIVIGWGRFNDASQSLSDDLRFVSLPITADRVCENVYNQDYRYFQPTNICINGARGSSCNGDSGGGMHLTINGEMAIIGIVSYGSATCEGGHPPVMTRVTSYLDWISSSTGIVIS